MNHHVNDPTAAMRTLQFYCNPSIISTCLSRHIKTVLTTSSVFLLQLKPFLASHHIRSVSKSRHRTLKTFLFLTLLFLWAEAGI